MAESDQQFVVDEYEPHGFPGAESEDQILDGNDGEQEILVGSEFDQQTYSLDGDQPFMGHESEHFDVLETEDDTTLVHEQSFGEIESEHQLAENEANQDLLENDMKQEFTDIDQSDIKEGDEELHSEGKQGQMNDAAAVTDDKKWPGWPGDSVFRMLVPAQKVGNIIGRKGEYIKKMVEETRARIKILDGPPGTAERAVLSAFFKATKQTSLSQI